ncbi:DUF1648 domain-containing protein [Limnochorda pilosa]|uniref:DUF1648 domain-containing protein n=1 Tax=Limnochorda pilosa TaxID=1555112 RepID=A0A0K2SH25_LIMPI|nr:DUF1648 domain-containing protein [Limnochorda pilosa]BAS26390.1 hypothetical protein LIP_0533 [Limnochorda pilosa]
MSTESPERLASMPASRLERSLDTIALAVIVVQIGWLLFLWPGLPDRVPIHFDLAGQPDAWGSKGNLWFLPAVQVFLYGLIALTLRFPHFWNFPVPVTPENRERLHGLARVMLRCLRAEVAVLLGLGTRQGVQVARGAASGLGWSMPVFLAVIFGTLGLFLIQMVRERPGRRP